jgi:hypothetical protein
MSDHNFGLDELEDGGVINIGLVPAGTIPQ